MKKEDYQKFAMEHGNVISRENTNDPVFAIDFVLRYRHFMSNEEFIRAMKNATRIYPVSDGKIYEEVLLGSDYKTIMDKARGQELIDIVNRIPDIPELFKTMITNSYRNGSISIHYLEDFVKDPDLKNHFIK